MPLTIKNVLDKFDEITTDEDGLILSGLDLLTVRQFLQDNLTLMLDEIRKEAIEQSTGGADRYEISYITLGKLLNIINSHK